MSETGGKPRRKELTAKIHELQSKLKISSDKLKVTHNKLAQFVWALVVCMAGLCIMAGLFTWSNTSLKTAKTAIQELENRLNEAQRINLNLQTEMDNLRPKYEHLDSMFVNPYATYLSFPTTQISTFDSSILQGGTIRCRLFYPEYPRFDFNPPLGMPEHRCENDAWIGNNVPILNVSETATSEDFIRCFRLENGRVWPESCTIHIQSGRNRPIVSESPIAPWNSFVGQILCNFRRFFWRFVWIVVIRITLFLDHFGDHVLECFDVWYSVILFFYKPIVWAFIMGSLPAFILWGGVLHKYIKDGMFSPEKWVRNERIMDMRIRFAKWLKKGMQKKKNDVETDLKPVQHVSSVEEKEASTTKDPKLPSEETESNVEADLKKVWVMNYETSEFEKVDAKQIFITMSQLSRCLKDHSYVIRKNEIPNYALIQCDFMSPSSYKPHSYTRTQLIEVFLRYNDLKD